MKCRRGDIWLVAFGDPEGREQSGTRPAVVVSSDLLNEGPSGIVIVVPATTSHRGLPSHIEITKGDSGLDEVSYAKCEDVKSVSDRRLITRLGETGPAVMFEISRALRLLMDLIA
ncbi:MAG: type II toxin-antitoxin system PemK/MazF family toxin [Actinomycetota bacterium]